MLNHRSDQGSSERTAESDEDDRGRGDRIRRLEEALADYVARYGLTDLAREALKPDGGD
jgi:hypothetical protein